jgi:hypothetical protein
LPTLAIGKGWGDFDIQATVGGVLPSSGVAVVGDQIQTNVAFQYHLLKVFWPEFEVNWTYYVDGQRGGLNQVFLTPGLVIGRFKLTDGILFKPGRAGDNLYVPVVGQLDTRLSRGRSCGR